MIVLANIGVSMLAVVDGEIWVFYNRHRWTNYTPARVYGPLSTVHRFADILDVVHERR